MRCLKIHNTNVSRSISYPIAPHTDIILFRSFLDILCCHVLLKQRIYSQLLDLCVCNKQIIHILIDLLFHFSQTRQISCINRITLSGNFILVAILITSIRTLVFTCFLISASIIFSGWMNLIHLPCICFFLRNFPVKNAMK